MTVYGDPQFEITLDKALAQLRERLEKTSPHSLENLRSLLIQAGQLEQGIADHAGSGIPQNEREIAQRITNYAAAAFCGAYANENQLMAKGVRTIDESLRQLRHTLSNLTACCESLRIKVPEGFAFYSLFPEQYCLAAMEWYGRHLGASDQMVLVIGLRSIGTTLSAVVAATLSAAGCNVHRLTVRPTGPPFHRRVTIPPALLRAATWALIVDEGPGLSGSSMAGTADALFEAGLEKERVTFLPGHENPPGPAADERIRHLWNSIPCSITPTDAIRWHGLSLGERFAAQSAQLCGINESFSVEDVSGGLWRAMVFPDQESWPAINPCFDRMKFVCRHRNGLSILWKFYGLSFTADFHQPMAHAAFLEMSRRASILSLPMPLGQSCGFVAIPWIEGPRLTPAHADNDRILEHIARYLAAVAGSILLPEEREAAMRRLDLILTSPAVKEFGVHRPESMRLPTALPRYGDGRMAPSEWVQLRSGEILKTNSIKHDCDHTSVGCQPIHWDIAGVAVEWSLTAERLTRLLGFLAELIPGLTSESVAFFCGAYAAFRLGMSRLAAESAESSEKGRLLRAADFYSDRLQYFARGDLIHL